MTITIDLHPETEQRLREMAAVEGKDLSAVVLESIEEHVRKAKRKAARKKRSDRAIEKWLEEFDALIKSHPQVDHPVDDSRESIYPD